VHLNFKFCRKKDGSWEVFVIVVEAMKAYAVRRDDQYSFVLLVRLFICLPFLLDVLGNVVIGK
jgi:hypothetical protein